MHLWTEPDLDAIHETALLTIEQVGIDIGSPPAREALLRFGCTAGSDSRVRIPRAAVAEALSLCPREFRHPARDQRRDLAIDCGAAQTYVHNMAGAATVCDPRSGARRPATCLDQARLTRVMHHLRNQRLVCPMVQLQDVPDALEPLYSYLICAWETDKALSAPGIESGGQARYLWEMARLALDARDAGGPAIDFYACSLSPLCWPTADSEKLLAMASLGQVEVMIIAEPTAGTTAPITLAAAIAQQHAELLAGVVLLQAVAPGTPTTLGPRLGVADLRSGLMASGAYSTGLASVAAVELARRDGLACDCYGLCTDSMVPDAQFGYERAINGLLGLAAQPRYLSGMGDLQSGMTTCPEALVIDDDIVSHLLAAAEPHASDDPMLGVQIVGAGVAASAGFLALDHTRRHRAREAVETRVAYNGGLGQWTHGGRRDVCERASDAVSEILAHDPVGLPQETVDELCSLIDRAAREMGIDDYPDPRRIVQDCSMQAAQEPKEMR